MVRIILGPQTSWSKSDANQSVDEWLAEQNEWEADPVNHTLNDRTDSGDPSGVTWWVGDYRIETDSGSKTEILDALESKIASGPQWYRIGYHECDHDEGDRSGCEWTDEREGGPGNAPIAVPAFQ